jgi:hypothetical protein
MSQTLVFMSNAVEVIEGTVAYPVAVAPDLEALQKNVVHGVFEKSRV